jgi:hypothetical protein
LIYRLLRLKIAVNHLGDAWLAIVLRGLNSLRKNELGRCLDIAGVASSILATPTIKKGPEVCGFPGLLLPADKVRARLWPAGGPVDTQPSLRERLAGLIRAGDVKTSTPDCK